MTQREFPTRPLVGVGAVIIDTTGHGRGASARVLLARRGRAPSLGEWSIPGGLVKVGEPLEDAVAREVLEETGLRVRVGAMIEVLDRIIYEEEPKQRKQRNAKSGAAVARVRPSSELRPLQRRSKSLPAQVQYHYVIIDYLCRLAPRCSPASARAGSDATELRWATRTEAAAMRLRPALQRVLRRAFAQTRA